MKIALSITHAPWIEDRARSLARLLRRLDLNGDAFNAAPDRFHLETTPGPNWKWGESQWNWAASTGADVAVFLQDDSLVPEEPGSFWRYLKAMLLAVGADKLIGMHSRHPDAEEIAQSGRHWYSSTELVGTGYVFPRDLLTEFLAWRSAIGPEAARSTDEDTSIGHGWARSTGKRIWHPIPSIVDHDVSLPSTAGNDEHPDRRPTILWGDGDRFGWAPEDLASLDFWSKGVDAAPHYVLHHKHLSVNA